MWCQGPAFWFVLLTFNAPYRAHVGAKSRQSIPLAACEWLDSTWHGSCAPRLLDASLTIACIRWAHMAAFVEE